MLRALYFLLGVLMPPWLGQCQYKVYRQDPFALLSGTLQTYQEASCDNEALSLECPPGTKISIQLVQYGRSAPSAQVRKELGRRKAYYLVHPFVPLKKKLIFRPLSLYSIGNKIDAYSFKVNCK